MSAPAAGCLRWKVVDSAKVIKARLCIRGYEDSDREVSTFASTTSRWGQRVVTSVAVERSWRISTLDVGTAFLQGMTFQQLSELDDLPERVIAFEQPRGSESLVNELPGHESYNSAQHVLRLLKPAYVTPRRRGALHWTNAFSPMVFTRLLQTQEYIVHTIPQAA